MTDINPNSIDEDEYATVYRVVSRELLQEADEEEGLSNSIFNDVLQRFKNEFDSGGYSNEQLAIAKSQFFASAYGVLEAQANSTTLHILDSKASERLVDAKVNLTNREIKGYDDGLRTKEAEFNGQVASFAINADSSNMQEVVDRFNLSINNITPDGTFGVLTVDPIADADTKVTGNCSGIYAKEGDAIEITANSVVYNTSLDSGLRFDMTIDTANIIAAQTIVVKCTLTDSDSNIVVLTVNSLVS